MYCDTLECAQVKPCIKHELWEPLRLMVDDKPNCLYKYANDFCIIELRYPTLAECPKFQCNETRQVVDKRFAKYRANCLYVVRILDVENGAWKQQCSALRDPKTIYRVGELVFPNGYEPNQDIVCGQGIHYFLTLQAVFCLLIECHLGYLLVTEDGTALPGTKSFLELLDISDPCFKHPFVPDRFKRLEHMFR
jgi:hypothetical protein